MQLPLVLSVVLVPLLLVWEAGEQLVRVAYGVWKLENHVLDPLGLSRLHPHDGLVSTAETEMGRCPHREDALVVWPGVKKA